MKSIKAQVQCFNGEFELHKAEDLAKELGVHIATIRRYIKQGKLKARRIGHNYMVSKESFRDFIEGK